MIGLVILAIWTAVAAIIATIVRANLGDREEAWDEYISALTDEYDCPRTVFVSIALLPGLISVATWDWALWPLITWPFRAFSRWGMKKKVKQAIKRLPPFEQECHKKIQQIREQVQELQNTLNAQYKDNDPDTPSAETQRLVKEKIEQLEKAENELWAQVSHLPMGDLPVHQCLEISEKVLTEARELLQDADDPDIRILRGAAPTKEEEEAAREELRQ